MLKRIVLFNLVFICMAAALFPRAASALDVSVGGTVWYSKWDPMWESNFNIMFGDESIEEKTVTRMDPSYLFGPVVSVRFMGNWRLSANLLYGKYRTETMLGIKDGSSIYVANYDMDIEKLDQDTTLTYSFNRYFNIFAGFKYQRYSFKRELYVIFPADNEALERKLTSQSIGPGAGIGIALPLGDGFAILGNFSGILMFMEMEDKWYPYSTKTGYPTYKYSMRAWGYSSSLSFAYYVPNLKLTFVTSLKYQYLKFNQKDVSGTDPSTLAAEDIRKTRNFDGTEDTFVGISLTVLYSFSI